MPAHTSSRAGSIAGLLLIGSCALVIATVGIWFTGGPVGLGTIGVPGIGGLVLLAAIVFASVGFGIIALVGPDPLCEPVPRIGLGLMAVGLAGTAASSAIAASLTYDSMENWPAILFGLGGLSGLGIGILVTIVGFLLTSGRPRRLALAFLGGLVLEAIGGNVVASLLFEGAVHDDARPLLAIGIAFALIGVTAMLAVFAGIGWLVVASDRHPASVPA